MLDASLSAGGKGKERRGFTNVILASFFAGLRKSISLDTNLPTACVKIFMNRHNQQADVTRVHLRGWYAMVLGPVVGAAIGLPAFWQGNAGFAGSMVGLFAAIGMIAGCGLCVCDWWFGRTKSGKD